MTIMVKKFKKIPAIRTPAITNTVPCRSTVEGGIRPLGKGRFFVRSMTASISRSMYILSMVEPETARNRETISKKSLIRFTPESYEEIR